MTPRKSPHTPKIRTTYPAADVAGALDQLTDFLLKKFDIEKGNVALVGIQTRGAIIARRVADRIKAKKGVELPLGAIDITLYRDDFSTSGIQPIVGDTSLDFAIDDKVIILIDDVLFTGRTIRAALDELMDFGRPQRIALAVLIDRGHRELPIQPDFAALTVATKRNETVNLHLTETDQREEILVCEPLEP